MKAPPLNLTQGAVVQIGEHSFRISKIDDDGNAVLVCTLRGHTVRFLLDELVDLHLQGKLRAIRATDTDAQKDKPPLRFPAKQLTKEQRYRVARRIAYVNATRSLYPVGPRNPRLVQCILDVAERTKDRRPPSPHSVYRWLKRYVNSGYDSGIFVQDAGVYRQRKARIPNNVKEVLQQHIEKLMNQNIGATLRGVTNKALALTARDMGYSTFFTHNGLPMMTDEFLSK